MNRVQEKTHSVEENEVETLVTTSEAYSLQIAANILQRDIIIIPTLMLY